MCVKRTMDTNLNRHWVMWCDFNKHLCLFLKNRKCQRTVRPHELVRITFAGCATTQRYRPRTCGTCTDGRCCTPSLSRTVKLHFHCPNGESFHRNIMWIQRCSCSSSYCRPSIPAGPSFSLHNDIHTFRHWVVGGKRLPLQSCCLPLPQQYARLHFKLPATTTSVCPHARCVISFLSKQHWRQHTAVCCCVSLLPESLYWNILYLFVTFCSLLQRRHDDMSHTQFIRTKDKYWATDTCLISHSVYA